MTRDQLLAVSTFFAARIDECPCSLQICNDPVYVTTLPDVVMYKLPMFKTCCKAIASDCLAVWHDSARHYRAYSRFTVSSQPSAIYGSSALDCPIARPVVNRPNTRNGCALAWYCTSFLMGSGMKYLYWKKICSTQHDFLHHVETRSRAHKQLFTKAANDVLQHEDIYACGHCESIALAV